MERIKKFNAISEVLYRLNVQAKIDLKLLENAFDSALSYPKKSIRDVQLGAILTGIMAKGPTVNEVVTLLKCAFKLDKFDPTERYRIKIPKGELLVGAIGSGKKGIKTMNISTPALLVAASAGAFTAKVVSSSTSSLTGSADFLQEVGVNLNHSIKSMERIILKTKFGAFPIENLLPKFNSIYAKKFYAPHALSFGLAALASPIEYDNFLYGLAHPNIDLSVQVLKKFGVRNVMVVSTTHDGIHYLDEMGVYGITKIKGIQNGKIGYTKVFNPLIELNLPKYRPSDICEGKNKKENIKLVLDVLRGKGERAREDIICINAGTILYLAKKAKNLKEGYMIAKRVVKEGLPFKKLLEVIKESGGDERKIMRYL
jgi:anthranilate phosphoribosyltransferase